MRTDLTRLPRTMRGMTLIELMTVMLVLGVLTTIAVSSYRRYMIRSNRTEATAQLLRVQVAQEKFFLQNNTYTDDLTLELAKGGLGFESDETPRRMYKIAITEPDADGASLATGYVATATAQGGQADDKDCETMTIDDRGVRGSAPGSPDLCWR